MQNSNPVQKLEAYMVRKKFRHRTIVSYKHYVEKVQYDCGKDIYHLTADDFNNHIDKVVSFLSSSYINGIISAGKLFLKYGLEKTDLSIRKLERPRKSHYIPDVLSQQEVKQLIACYKNIKHKAIIAFIYCHGLRRSECINFKVSHFDKSRKVIKIIDSKGAKDRIIDLNNDCRDILVKYWMKFNPKEYLFTGQNGEKYSETSIRNILDAGLKRCRISKNITIHCLRHSFATHLYENGIPIEVISKILGHNSLKTTLIYTKISTANYNLQLKII